MKSFILILFVVGLTGCGGFIEVSPTPVGNSVLEGEPKATLSFATIKTVVFGSRSGHCLNCHSAEKGNQGGINLETHAGLPEMDRIRSAIDTGFMPFDGGRLGDAENRLLVRWIEAGFPEFSDEPLDDGTEANVPAGI